MSFLDTLIGKSSRQEGLPGLSEAERWAGFAAMRDERVMKVLTAYRDYYKDKGFRERDAEKRIGYIERHDLLDKFIKRIGESSARLETLRRSDDLHTKQRELTQQRQSGIL